MRFFNRLFQSESSKNAQVPYIALGRYSDSYKKQENYQAWNRSLHLFEEGRYLEAYEHFLIYLRDEQEDNVHFTLQEGTLDFELFQGSKRIQGTADGSKVKAVAKIVRPEELNVGFMRSLIEKNFTLKFSRFALDEDRDISIVFDTFTLDGSPFKLYHALKELSTSADKQDDLLIDEFSKLERVSNAPVEDIEQEEKEVKYRFIVGEIESVKNKLNEGLVNREQYPGAFTYLLLNLIYKLDYLTEPEGYMMEALERMHRLYFANDGKSIIEKNGLIVKELDKLLGRSKEQFFKEMYRVRFTFGITTPVNHDRITGFIDTELHHMDWYLANKHYDVAMAIPGYIVGYSLFSYAPPKPVRELLQLYYFITESRYFQDLGFQTPLFDFEALTLQEKRIKQAIKQIVQENKAQYPKLTANTGSLVFKSLPDFAKSYLLMIRSMDPVKAW